jgi:hypothetical protein
VKTKTGNIWFDLEEGTDSNVYIQLRDKDGHETVFYDLNNPGDDFKPGCQDTFNIIVQGITPPLESVTIRKDNAGGAPDWYLDHVEVLIF